MASFLQQQKLFFFTLILCSQLLLLVLLLYPLSVAANPSPKSHIVYMGRSNRDQVDIEDAKLAHLSLLSSVIPSHEKERLSLNHIYHRSFKGFSAMLTEEEASLLSSQDEIISVFPDPKLKLHTTRSWNYLDSRSGITQLQRRYPNGSNDVIIGIIDSGIWPESPSFNDDGFRAIPSRWKGTCMEGVDFKKSHCNKKLIGVRYYNLSQTQPSRSPRDWANHGTHVASTAGGVGIPNANYNGVARGLAKGGFPSSRLAIYKACSNRDGCPGSALLMAIEDAIQDGVDIISMSLGLSSSLKFLSDPIAIGSLHADQHGIMVICGAGNDGPSPYTVYNVAPWMFTVAASTIDRAFGTNVRLGNQDVIQGFGMNIPNLNGSVTYPLAFGKDAAINSSDLAAASNCAMGSLDGKKVAGKILLCVDTMSDPDDDLSNDKRSTKTLTALIAGAVGTIMVDEATQTKGSIPFESKSFPFAQVDKIAAARIIKYIESTKKPSVTFLPTADILGFKPTPAIGDFSSRGPGNLTESILKPDITAPGVNILASVPPSDGNGGFSLGKPTEFGLQSGTSMACPHVSGAAAYIKSLRRSWTPSMIKSALMTTATVTNNAGRPITDNFDAVATPHQMGAGEIRPSSALFPGLVYESEVTDYLKFLCYYGYKTKIISSLFDRKFKCPPKSSEDLISDLNYPTISISKLRGARTITRTVTNVGPKNSTYYVKIDSPKGMAVHVSPSRLVFSKENNKASYKVTFDGKGAKKGYKFGSVTWSDGRHLVRLMFAVNII